jgi:hypothetical protein
MQTNNTPPTEPDAQQPTDKGLDDAICSRALSNALEMIRVESRIADAQISDAEDVYRAVKKLYDDAADKLARLRTQKRGLVARANSIIANVKRTCADD